MDRFSQYTSAPGGYRLSRIGTPPRRDYLTSNKLKDFRKTAETCANTRQVAIRRSRKISAWRPNSTLIGYRRRARKLRTMMNPRMQAVYTWATATGNTRAKESSHAVIPSEKIFRREGEYWTIAAKER